MKNDGIPKAVYIIAEAGVNHNGSLDMARDLIEVAAKSGANAVKFQTFKAEKLVTADAEKAAYQKKMAGTDDFQLDMLRKLELDASDHISLIECCRDNRIEFLSTPFDTESLELLANQFDISRIKIPSGEITNGPLLLQAARTGKPIILSTGMSTLADVEAALAVLAYGYSNIEGEPSSTLFPSAYSSSRGQALLRDKVVLLHCTTEYPAPFYEVNLQAMDTLQAAFGLPVGFSDHTAGIAIALAAAARGATIVEKHFTMDRTLPGPDHQASVEPSELIELVRGIRQIEQAVGCGLKCPAASERKNMAIARKSLIASRPIKCGETFNEQNLGIKRPGDGISPMQYWNWLGKKADRNYRKDERIDK